ncbi:hypothetical protein J7U37_20280 [Methylobacterium sp. 37f]|nr:hypothetical protein [Methylobacterium sp. 37f]
MGATKRSFDRSNAMVSSTGSANAYVLTYTQVPEGYVKGEVYRFFANATNTGAATININGLGTRSILRADGSALSPGEIVVGQVVTVVCDGANFLHQSVGSRFFKDSVSIVKDGDAILTLEDTGAAATTFRSKNIYSSRNVGGGNDWLFRSRRPSDGAIEDFTLKTGTGGTIWTTGNFNPDLKANLAGAVFSGDITSHRGDKSGVIFLGRQDQNGGRYLYYDGSNYQMPGSQLFVNGSQVWKRDDFDPNTKVTVNSQPRFNGLLPALTGEGYIYSDGGTSNLRFRSGPASAYKYAGLNDDGNFQIFNGGVEAAGDVHAVGAVRANGRVVVGEGGNASYIEMRDSDEGTRFIHNNSGLIGFLGADGGWKARVGDDGKFWTAELGDLNTRIEARGAAYRDSANANTSANYMAKTGAAANGGLYINGGSSYANVQPSLSLFYGGLEHWNIMAASDGNLYFRNGDNGDARMRLNRDGSLWTKQFGDLNQRIEDRTANRRDEANANTAANYFNKATGTQQNVNNIPSFNAAAIDIVRGGVLRARWVVDGSGNTILQNGDNGDNFFYVNTGGAVWTKQFGDLNTRIEDRAYAHAAGQAGSRVSKTGDTMTGTLEIQGAYPTLRLHYPNVRYWDMNVREWGGISLTPNGSGETHQFKADGSIWTSQMGDINSRIETRAREWAETRQGTLGFIPVQQSGGAYQGNNKVYLGWDGAALRAQVDASDLERVVTRSWCNPIIDIRMTLAGDLNNDWNNNYSYSEPYGGAVVTSRASGLATNSQQMIFGMRWRYLQKQDSYGNWYTVGYV